LKKVQLDPKEAALVEWTCLAWSADGKWLAAGSTLGALHLYDAATGKEHAKIPGIRGQVLGVAWSPDGRWLASSSTDTTVLIWNARRWTKGANPVTADRPS
jgi:WD40 repeat protein